tara:strand:- start:7525 stop:8298 length:774 start_codon:yes stop_codon:yes gene_type:complete
MHLKKKIIGVISVIKGVKPSLYVSFDSLYEQDLEYVRHLIIYKDINDQEIEILKKKYEKSLFIKENTNNYKNKFFAINQAINSLDTEYICFLHDDDRYINKNYLSDSIKKIINDKIDVLSSNIIFETNGIKKREWILDKEFNLFSFHNIPAHTSIIYKKDYHEKIGEYSLDFPIAADFDFMIKLFSVQNLKTARINYTSLSMNIGGDSTNLKNFLKVFKEDLKIFKNNNLSFAFIRTILKKVLKIRQLNGLPYSKKI